MKIQQLQNKRLFGTVISLALLAGCSQPDSRYEINPSVETSAPGATEQVAAESERLGTQWGDEVTSQVRKVDLRRVSSEPMDNVQVNYADKYYSGRALNSISLIAGKVDFAVQSDRSRLPIYRDAGNYYLQGRAGQAYSLTYRNNSDKIYEIVASVDGVDVLDGSPASRYNSGYVLNPHDTLVIEGFRKSQNAVASFIFSKPEDAYAANTPSGAIQNTGVIGTVVYELYDPKKPRYQQPQAYPADNGYAPAPQ